MNLTDASIPLLVRELSRRLPTEVGGHVVTSVSLALDMKDGEHDWVFHLRLEDGRTACGRTLAPVRDFGALDREASWALFEARQSPSQFSAALIASGDAARIQLFNTSSK